MKWLIKLRNVYGRQNPQRVSLSKEQAEELATMILVNEPHRINEHGVEYYKWCFNKREEDFYLNHPICIGDNTLTLLRGITILSGFIASDIQTFRPYIIFFDEDTFASLEEIKPLTPLVLPKHLIKFLKGNAKKEGIKVIDQTKKK